MQDNAAYLEQRINKLAERIEIIEEEHLKWEHLIAEILVSIKIKFEELKNE